MWLKPNMMVSTSLFQFNCLLHNSFAQQLQHRADECNFAHSGLELDDDLVSKTQTKIPSISCSTFDADTDICSYKDQSDCTHSQTLCLYILAFWQGKGNSKSLYFPLNSAFRAKAHCAIHDSSILQLKSFPDGSGSHET